MGSFKGRDRNQDRKGLRGRLVHRGAPGIESLERRMLLDGGGGNDIQPTWRPNSNSLYDVKNGPLALEGPTLIGLYKEFHTFREAGNSGAFVSSQAGFIRLSGDYVGVDVHAFGDLTPFVATLKNLGMQVEQVSSQYNVVEGLIPIAQLPTLANLPQIVDVTAIYVPQLQQQGISPNQGDQVLGTDVARTQFNVDGRGVTVGVLSDSVSKFGNGLADSVKTGDLPNNVAVLQDLPASAGAGTDEGRAMLEEIHDIAPGAGLAFYTAATGPLGFAAGIQALAGFGAQIIVDDVRYFAEPMFQDGIIAQAVTDVTKSKNVTYFSSAGNSASAGYESAWRGTDATVGSLGAGHFMNFNPGQGAAVTQLPVTVNSQGSVVFQYDNPFKTNGVTTDLDFFFLDGSGNVVASGTSNNIATGQPIELFISPGAGQYTVAIEVKGGAPDVGRVRFQGGTADLTISKQFGAAGQTTYPTTYGHAVSNEAIGVGAVPWYGAPPFSTTTPIKNEDFSSFGPVNIVFDAQGNRLPTVDHRLKPDFSGPDGINTSFFGSPPGSVPPNLPANVYTLPNFYGTSAAAPNLAALAALGKQLVPSATLSDFKSAFLAAATPLNGAAQGVWDQQGGFGLPNASKVFTALDKLRINSFSPGGGSTLISLPNVVTVTFSKAINFSTVQASDLTVTGPNGVTITVGTPIAVGDPNFPTVVQFPITLTRAQGSIANGLYTLGIASGAITSKDGKPLIGATDKFTLSDNIAPTIVSSDISGRIIKLRFSEAIDPATINVNTVELVRANNPSGAFGPNLGNVFLQLDSRVILSYDPKTFTITLDLSALPQTFLPTDTYALIALSPVVGIGGTPSQPGLTDLVGNALDGEFTGRFPSGDGKPGGTFNENFGQVVLTAPIFNRVSLAPTSDSGIPNDSNTNVVKPGFVGQIGSAFPGTAAGLTILAEFNGLHGGNLDLATGFGGRGFVGNYDAIITTDASGSFNLAVPSNLPDGFNKVRFVVLGEPDSPPLPGFSTQIDYTFRIDTSLPTIDTSGTHPSGASIAQDSSLASLNSVTLYFTDPVLPSSLTSPFAVPTQLSFFALDPASATNISNYALINYGADRQPGGGDDTDYSAFIKTAVFASTTNRGLTSDPYTGTVTLTFSSGLPKGRYALVAKSDLASNSGIKDSVGNLLAGDPTASNTVNPYVLTFDYQPEPVYVTAVNAKLSDADPNNYDIRSFFEIPTPGVTPRAAAPPTVFNIDFSNSLPDTVDYTTTVQLIASANTYGGKSDGNFGDFGITNTGSGYSIVPGTTVSLASSNPAAQPGQPGFNNRLVLRLADNTTLLPDYYPLYIPTTGTNIIRDVFGNQLDGEFRANKTADGASYEDLLLNGQYRQGLSGNGVQGGSFVTGYEVVATGNVIYARPDYIDDPFNLADDPDGSLAKPYAALAPEAVPNALNGGDLNSQLNFGTGFNSVYDRNGNGHFDRSAFFAAQQLAALGNGPVVVIALPGTLIRNPFTGAQSQKTFVMQAPAGTDPLINDGSASVPAMTTLIFQPGSTLKMLNASLFAQNQGSAIQLRGGPSVATQVNITSFNDDSVGGDTNGDGSDSTPRGGDFGGLVFRNYDQSNRTSLFAGQIPTTGNNAVDGKLKAFDGTDAISGSDDVMSYIDSTKIRFGGGAVPQTIGTRYDAITLVNARTSITNSAVSDSGGATGAQAGISGNVDSFREDQILRGPVIRRTVLTNNSINGIYVRAELNGVAEPTDAIHYPLNPSNLGGARNFVFDSPLPFVFTSRIVMGAVFLQETSGQTSSEADRLYIEPGMLLKFQRGAALETEHIGGARQPSINLGDRTYINQFDLNPNLSPSSPNFRPATIGDAPVLFTSFFDDKATTAFFDPITQVTTTITPMIDSDNGGPIYQPTGGLVDPLARWGDIAIAAGTILVMDETELRYGGGTVNTATGTAGAPSVLTFRGADFTTLGTHAYVTNNNIHDNLGAAITDEPDGLLAADAQRPLRSGHPFFRGNILVNNDRNGLEVLSSILPPGVIGASGSFATQSANTVWDTTDLTYLLRSTIVLAGQFTPPAGSVNQLNVIPTPAVTLTLQSALPDTLLANGEKIARPGESLLVKLLSALTPLGDGINGQPAGITSNNVLGAGFAVGFDNGIDPTTDSLIDSGVNSQIRILGIGANETTGQLRVPVIITSFHDDSVGKTVHNVTMNQALTGNTTAPAAGDGGVILFGGQQLTSYNLFDPRQGSLIDNADIKYMTRIEQVGRVYYRLFDVNGDGGFGPADNLEIQKAGLPLGGLAGFGDQFNQPNAMTISNSSFSTFSQVGFIAHPGFNTIALAMNYPQGPPNPARIGSLGGPTNTYFINDTWSNMPVAIRVNSEVADNAAFPTPPQTVVLNNTFYNNGVSFHSQSIAYNGQNSLSHSFFLLMNDIFANSTTAAVEVVGQATGSQLQYCLFDGNAANVVLTQADFFGGNQQPVFGKALFRDPANGNFNLQPTSDAIDASRSEIGPLLIGNMLNPAIDQTLNGTVGTRNTTGRVNWGGGLGIAGGAGFGFGYTPTNLDEVTLPGYPIRNFKDQFVPVLQGTPNSYTGTASTPGLTYAYMPIAGERDVLGYFRQDDPNKANVGFGSRPFFDIGAYEYRQLFPPHIIDVQASITDPTAPTGSSIIDIYKVGGIAGTNKSPQTIQVQFDSRLDTSTINNSTVLLDASGGDGIFGNGNSAADRTIDLSGKLSFDQVTKILTINLAASGLVLSNDEYRIRILGNGSSVVRDQSGNALDGENLDVNGAQRALPSGDGFPGGNFVVTFTIDTNSPSVVGGTFRLDPATDSNRPDNITNNNMPTFIGTITDIFPPKNFLQGQTVILDVSTKGDGNFDLLNIGTGTTDNAGNFSVTATKPIPESPYIVGPDGIFGTPDDGGYALARVRVIDQSGNVSLPITAPLSAFINAGAIASFVIDTTGPRITSFSPVSKTLASLSSGVVPITIGFNENVDPASINSASIKVIRAGGDGVFGNGNDVPLSIDPNSIVITYLHDAKGAELVTFNVTGNFANDIYRVTVSGTSTPVIDIAGNSLDGENKGVFPSGDGVPGGDYVTDFVVYDPTLIHKIFVGQTITDPKATIGTRANPYPTIMAGLAVALTGDEVAVLPGVYTESVVLKSLVSLVSADNASDDTTLIPGDPLKTIIRAPQSTGVNPIATVTGTNLLSVQGGTSLNTELSGFTIASPLFGDPATGPILTNATGLALVNSDILVDRNYFIDAAAGVTVTTFGDNAATPRFINNGIIGNLIGMIISDANGATNSLTGPTTLTNNTFAFNDYGLVVNGSNNDPLLVTVTNNIFWQNHDLTLARAGTGILASVPFKIQLTNNLFSGNGQSQTSPADDAVGIGGVFDPSILSSTPDILGNIAGDPRFVAPRDPRPTADGPGVFFNDANFDLTLPSAAIDRGLDSAAPSLDFLYRARRLVRGPSVSDIGAFEFQGLGGKAAGGQLFRVVTTSLAPGGASVAGAASLASAAAPRFVDVTFSDNPDKASVNINDIVISGTGVNQFNPIHATSLSWVDDHTVRFNLDGAYNSSGSLRIDIPQGSVRNQQGVGVASLNDSVNLVAPVPIPQPPIPQPPIPQPPIPQPPVTPPGGKHHLPVVKHPVVKHPVVKHPVVKHPVFKAPVFKAPVVKHPVLKSPVLKKH